MLAAQGGIGCQAYRRPNQANSFRPPLPGQPLPLSFLPMLLVFALPHRVMAGVSCPRLLPCSGQTALLGLCSISRAVGVCPSHPPSPLWNSVLHSFFSWVTRVIRSPSPAHTHTHTSLSREYPLMLDNECPGSRSCFRWSPRDTSLFLFFPLWSKRVAGTGPAFDPPSLYYRLTAQPGKGWRLQTHAGTIFSSPLGVLFFPCSEKVQPVRALL